MREITAFRRAYRESKYLSEVEALYQDVLKQLVSHELYVANFYLDRDKPRATIMRLEGILAQYPESNQIPEVMMLLGETYRTLKLYDRARNTFASLVERYPDSKYSTEAKKQLTSLEGR